QGSYTPLYAPPEQIMGSPPNPRDDVYSLGVIWHQLQTGDLTRGAPSGGAWRRRLAERGMDPGLTGLLESCVESQAEDRLPDARLLRENLTALLEGMRKRASTPEDRERSTSTGAGEWLGPVDMVCSDPGNLWANRNPWMQRERCEGWALHV